MKRRIFITGVLAILTLYSGCIIPGGGKNFTHDPLKELSEQEKILLEYPQLLMLEERFDSARMFFYLGDLESTTYSCNTLLEMISDLKSTLDNEHVCNYLDSLETDVTTLLNKAADEEIELDSRKHIVAVLDSIARNHVVEENIEVQLNWRTKHFIKYFKGRGKRNFKRWLRRVEKYRDVIEPILVEVGVPRDLLYLAVIESGLNLNARSRMKAVGPWQFMSRTAKLCGLRINWWIDERKDIVASTYAAAHYLKHLHNLFGSWPLALAAYNAGEYRIAYAISRQKTDDYWKLRLPQQTRWFVPKFMAALEIGRHPENYGFERPKVKPLEFDVITIDKSTELKLIAKAAGCSLRKLKSLNPALKRWATPPGMEVEIKLPKGTAEKCLAMLQSIPPEKRVSWLRHRIRKGETLWQIATRYEISISELKRINGIRNARRIKPNQILLIPVKDAKVESGKVVRARYKEKPKLPEKLNLTRYRPPRGYKKVVYRVRDGETLSEIAERFHVKLSSLRRWNNLRFTSLIHPGDDLVIYIPRNRKVNENITEITGGKNTNGKKIVHTVRKGETLSLISKKYNKKISQILQWNQGLKRDRIFVGEKIVIWLD